MKLDLFSVRLTEAGLIFVLHSDRGSGGEVTLLKAMILIVCATRCHFGGGRWRELTAILHSNMTVAGPA